LDMELYYPAENSNFTFSVCVFKPVCPNPVRRPTRNAIITHKWMVSEEHGRKPPFVRAPSPCRPGRLSPDRTLAYFLAISTCSANVHAKRSIKKEILKNPEIVSET
jgi:hypothetical protein